MKIVFFGLGSIGKRHARLLLDNFNFKLAAFRSGKGNETNELGLEEIYDWNRVIKFNPCIAFISNPTFLHITTALKCTELNCALFIEKPISMDVDGLNELTEIIKENNIVTYVAYNLRYHPVIEQLKNYCINNKLHYYRSVCTSYLPDWRPGIDHIKHYSSIREEGGGVVLELSHEIDLANYLLGCPLKIKGNTGKSSNVTFNAEDHANIFFESPKGNGHIHLNFFSHQSIRYIDIDFATFSVRGDLINNCISEYKNGNKIFSKNYELKRDDLYLKQLHYFFDNIQNPQMNNNLIEASTLFKEIIQYRETAFNE